MKAPVRRSASVKISSSYVIEVDEQSAKEEESRRWRRAKVREMSRSQFSKWCKSHLKSIKMRRVAEASEENDSWHLISKNASKGRDSKIDIHMYNGLKFPSSGSASHNRARFSVVPIEKENLDYISPDMTV